MDAKDLPVQSRTLFSLLIGLSKGEGETPSFAVAETVGPSSKTLLSELQLTATTKPGLRTVVVVVHRPLVGTLRRAATGRQPIRIRAMSLRQVRRCLQGQFWEEESSYALWPSGEAPSIAVPITSGGARRWVHRAGILGGGGKRVWLRALLRSRIVTPLMANSYPAVAVVLRRREGMEP